VIEIHTGEAHEETPTRNTFSGSAVLVHAVLAVRAVRAVRAPADGLSAAANYGVFPTADVVGRFPKAIQELDTREVDKPQCRGKIPGSWPAPPHEPGYSVQSGNF
jgi:hypothetical protein